MFCHERGEKLTKRRTRNADEQTIKAVIPQIAAVVQTISIRLRYTRDLVVRQTFRLNKFKGMGETIGKNQDMHTS